MISHIFLIIEFGMQILLLFLCFIGTEQVGQKRRCDSGFGLEVRNGLCEMNSDGHWEWLVGRMCPCPSLECEDIYGWVKRLNVL